MQQSKKVRYIIVLFLLGVSVVALVGWNICVGTVRIPLADIFASIRGEKIENSRILWDIRMPRTLAAMILGGALALAGYLLQTFFHNPIAGPFVLGISSGAKMVVAYATHPVLSGPAVKRITSSSLDELVVTDTIPLSDAARECSKIRQLSCAELLAETLKRINKGDSVMSLLKGMYDSDH